MRDESFKLVPLATSFGTRIVSSGSKHIAPQTLWSMLEQHGAVWLSGFEFTRDTFVELSDACCSRFSSYIGGAARFRTLDRHSYGAGGTLMSVTGADQPSTFALQLHGEMFYQRERPDVLWFYCETPASTGGETTIADGREIFARMSEDARSFFRTHNLLYSRELKDGDWQVMFQSDSLDDVRKFCQDKGERVEVAEDGSIRTDFIERAVFQDARGTEVFINSALVFYAIEQALKVGYQMSGGEVVTRPPFVVRQEDGSPLPAPLMAEVERVAEDVTVKITWQPGDVLVLDNSWVMHGRRKAADQKRTILARLGYSPELVTARVKNLGSTG